MLNFSVLFYYVLLSLVHLFSPAKPALKSLTTHATGGLVNAEGRLCECLGAHNTLLKRLIYEKQTDEILLDTSWDVLIILSMQQLGQFEAIQVTC